MTTTTQDIASQLSDIGFSLKVLSGPSPEVQGDWPCIAYRVELLHNEKSVLQTDYRLGVGHAKVPKRWEDQPPKLTADEVCAFNTLRNNPSAQLKDKALHASFSSKLAAHQKVTPSLPDVLHSLLMDGSAFFDAVSFEDWCSEYGENPDSRKAESTYRLCDSIGRKLAAKVPEKDLEKARAILSDY